MDDNKGDFVVLGDYLLFSSGAIREISQNSLGAFHPPPENPYECAKLVCKYWQKKLDLAVEEFDHYKQIYLSAARNKLTRDGNQGGPDVSEEEAVDKLTELKRKAEHYQRKLNNATAQLEINTPPQVKRCKDITELNRQRVSAFIDAVEAVEI